MYDISKKAISKIDGSSIRSIIATADDIPSLINATLKVARDEGWDIRYKTSFSETYYFPLYEPRGDKEFRKCEYHINELRLTLTPPTPKSPMQEQREKLETALDAMSTAQCDIMSTMEAIRVAISEMPEEGR